MNQQLTPQNAGELFEILQHLQEGSSQIEFEWIDIDGTPGKVTSDRSDTSIYWRSDGTTRHIAVALGGLIPLFRLTAPNTALCSEDDVVVHYTVNDKEVYFNFETLQGTYTRTLRFG
jgi:hypothetical protein